MSGSRETSMALYRLYCLDCIGRIGLAEWLEAETDADALTQVRDLKNGALKCEVWDGKRLVGTLSHDDLRPKRSTALSELCPLK